jgi:small GTP-binding protein
VFIVVNSLAGFLLSLNIIRTKPASKQRELLAANKKPPDCKLKIAYVAGGEKQDITWRLQSRAFRALFPSIVNRFDSHMLQGNPVICQFPSGFTIELKSYIFSFRVSQYHQPTDAAPSKFNCLCFIRMMFTILFIAFSFVGVKSFTLERRRNRNRPPSDTVSVGRRAASDGSEGDLLHSLETALDYEGRLPFKVNENEYHCGFVSIIGAANTGKSTLLNAILREDLCVATRRPQTTRHAIMGVITTETSQLLLVDTPGVIEDPAYKLQEGMMEAVMGAFKDADILLVVTDLFSTPIPDDVLFEKVKRSEKPKIVVINKVDLVEKVNPGANKGEEGRTVTVEEAVAKWRLLLPDSIAILPTFAFEGPENKGVVALRKILLGQDDVPAALRDLGRPIAGMFPHGSITITDQEARALLPISPPLYDEDTLTDRSERYVFMLC